MSNRKIPRIYEIARAATVSTSVDRCLTREQSAAQAELRSQFDVGNLAGGICVPWFERSAQGGQTEVKENVLKIPGRRGESITITTSEARSLSATGESSTPGDQGGMTVGTDVPEIGAAFRDKLVLERLGARVFGGLRGNVNFPRAKVALSASWISENAAAGDTSETLAMLSLAPYRLTASLPVSDELLMQGEGIEAHLRLELMAALAVECQRQLINGAGSASNQPLGIVSTSGIGSVVGGPNGAAPTYANLCDLEYAVTGTAKADRGNLAWLVSPAVRRKLRQTFINGTGSVPVWRENEAAALLGHAAGVTPSAPDNLVKGASGSICSAIIFGELSELFMSIWGPGPIVTAVRDAASASQGMTHLFATIYFNGGIRSPEAFAAMTDALC